MHPQDDFTFVERFHFVFIFVISTSFNFDFNTLYFLLLLLFIFISIIFFLFGFVSSPSLRHAYSRRFLLENVWSRGHCLRQVPIMSILTSNVSTYVCTYLSTLSSYGWMGAFHHSTLFFFFFSHSFFLLTRQRHRSWQWVNDCCVLPGGRREGELVAVWRQ